MAEVFTCPETFMDVVPKLLIVHRELDIWTFPGTVSVELRFVDVPIPTVPEMDSTFRVGTLLVTAIPVAVTFPVTHTFPETSRVDVGLVLLIPTE